MVQENVMVEMGLGSLVPRLPDLFNLVKARNIKKLGIGSGNKTRLGHEAMSYSYCSIIIVQF